MWRGANADPTASTPQPHIAQSQLPRQRSRLPATFDEATAMRPLLAACVCAISFALPMNDVSAQRAPKRPPLPATADTNDHNAYFQLGMQTVSKQPARAADAFYWATRLAPNWGDAYYAHRVAQHLTDPRRFARYFMGHRPTIRSSRVRQIDSLAVEALYRNPFYFARFERMMLDKVVEEVYGPTANISSRRTGDPAFDGYIAYAEGRFDDAIRYYGDALRRRPRDYEMRAPRARAFYHRMQFDSAANELTILLEEMRKRDEKQLVYFYDSKAMLEYTLARAYSAMNDTASARAALGRALEEDMSFHAAHAELAEIALAAGDTATALSELALTVELRASDVGARVRYGDVLMLSDRAQDAVEQYRAAIESEPYFAHPYLRLALALEELGNSGEAAAQYMEFLARSSQMHSDRSAAAQRLAQLQADGGGGSE
jgi:tetratricopeptide (TPR) repeat protein